MIYKSNNHENIIFIYYFYHSALRRCADRQEILCLDLQLKVSRNLQYSNMYYLSGKKLFLKRVYKTVSLD